MITEYTAPIHSRPTIATPMMVSVISEEETQTLTVVNTFFAFYCYVMFNFSLILSHIIIFYLSGL